MRLSRDISLLSIVLHLIILSISAYPDVTSSSLHSNYSQFLKKFNKTYEIDQIPLRIEIFKKNLDIIEQHNADPNRTFTKGLNMFSDMTDEEISTLNSSLFTLSTPIGTLSSYSDLYSSSTHSVAPRPNLLVNWPAQGVLGPIQNQGYCGGCYAFAGIAALEAALALKSHKKGRPIIHRQLSERQTIDCSEDQGNSGCFGGQMSLMYEYLMRFGVMTATAYPYTEAHIHPCLFKRSEARQVLRGYQMVGVGVERLEDAVMIQPVAAGIWASPDYQSYKKGVIRGGCEGGVGHAVTVVGLGVEDDIPYYLVRDSYGVEFGEEGHFKVERGNNALCLENQPMSVYPLV